jgi:beta-glucosidase
LKSPTRRAGNFHAGYFAKKADEVAAMINKQHFAALLCLLVSGFVPALTPLLAQQPRYPFNDPTLSVEARIDNFLSLMTSDEKIDCLSTRTAVPRLGIASMGSTEGIHGIVQRGSPVAAATRSARPSTPTTQFPQPPGMGETWDPAIGRQAGDVEGNEARFITQSKDSKRQMLIVWGPQADLARDPRWGRSEEVYGEDPFFNGTMVANFVKGLQGDDPKYWQAAALLKHFLANSNEDFRTSSSSDFDQRLFWEYYSVPFRMGFQEGGAKAVMASYNAWNGTPMILNPILKSVLEDKWGVDILSGDGGAVKLLVSPRKLFTTQEDAVVASIHAGINQFLEAVPEAKIALKEGKITEPEIDALLRRKFRVAIRLGILDPPEMNPYSKIKDSPEPWDTMAHKDVSKKIALESVVLLKNNNNFLPLKKDSIKSLSVNRYGLSPANQGCG